MSKKNIISVGFTLPGDLAEELSYDSRRSLMDADIVIFAPIVSPYLGYAPDTYLGKYSLTDDTSFQLKEDAAHWKRELTDTLSIGKTVFLMLSPLQEYYIATGQRTHSGTGRNQKTTRFVTEWNNYQELPFEVQVIASKGTSMKLNSTSEILKPMWSEFKEYFEYEVYLQSKVLKSLITTSQGNRIVGASYTPQGNKGNLILLPNISFDKPIFSEERTDEDGETNDYWTVDALSLGHKFIGSIVEIDKVIRRDQSLTPPPAWTKKEHYILGKEQQIQAELLKIETELSILSSEKDTLKAHLRDEGVLRSLLFEKGTALEQAILKALRILGFAATQYRDAKSEFDMVFESKEGRFLGESEGKDDKAIDISKLRQLEMNIMEDLEREEITSPAKGVLFGNAYRLIEVNSRSDFFTEKCKSAVTRTKTALVRTPDLFSVAKYLSDNEDQSFALQCRKSILSSEGGMVIFPTVPQLIIEKINLGEEADSDIDVTTHNNSIEQTSKGGCSS